MKSPINGSKETNVQWRCTLLVWPPHIYSYD